MHVLDLAVMKQRYTYVLNINSIQRVCVTFPFCHHQNNMYTK